MRLRRFLARFVRSRCLRSPLARLRPSRSRLPRLRVRTAPAAALSVAALTLLALPASAAGQEGDRAGDVAADTLPRYRLSELEVTVTRALRAIAAVPYAVAALDEAALRGLERSASLGDALWRVPGVFAQDRRNFALGDRISVRGAGSRAQFGVRGVRVLLDGIPLTLPDGQSTLENLDLAGLGRAEVIRGPAAALYGNAAAGVLSFRTQRPADVPLLLEPRLVAGSYGWREARLQASGSSADWSYLAAASRATTDGFRQHADAEILRGTAVAARALPGGGEARGLLNLYRAPFSRNPGSLTLADALERPRHVRPVLVNQGAGKETTQAQTGITVELPRGETGGLRAAGWGVRRDVWNPIPGTVIDLDRWAGGLRGELWGAARLAGLPLRWEVGLDLEAQADSRVERENLGLPREMPAVSEAGLAVSKAGPAVSEAGPAAGHAAGREGADGDDARTVEGERVLDQGERVLGVGPFVQLEADLTPTWTLTLAARFDTYDFRADDRLRMPEDASGGRTFRRLSPMAGLTWSPAADVHLFGHLTTGFQTPTTSELSNRPDGGGGFHPDLGPEKTVSVEAGARGAIPQARLGYTVSAFRARVRDALIPFEGTTGEVFFRNAGRVHRSGIEASATWEPTTAWRADLAYTLHRSRFARFRTDEEDFSGNDEPGVPGHALAVSLAHRAPFGLRSEGRVRWVDAYPVDDANTTRNPAYRVVDLRFGLDGAAAGTVRPFLGVDNLFDERYNGSVVPNAFGAAYFEPAPGIELYGGVELALPRGPAPRDR